MSDPTISIIIPAYNAEDHLAEAIGSALRQGGACIEVIVVDDGSTDGTRAAARRFEERGVRVLVNENSGAAAARNTGLEAATGNYIQYLDADDVLGEGKVERQMRMLQDMPDGWVASCGWGKFTGQPDEAQFAPQEVWRDFEDPLEWLTAAWEGGGMMQTACWLTPREVAERAGPWDETLKENPADDGEYFCRVLLESEGVRFCKEARVYYREPAESHVSENVSDRAVESLFMNCERYRQHVLAVEDSQRVRHALAVNYANFIYRFYPEYPELISKARERIEELGFDRVPIVGGDKFRWMARVIGFWNALKLRQIVKRR